MAIPATKGQLKTNIQDMQIGDYIACRYTAKTSGAAGTFYELGTSTAAEIPLNGSTTPDGLFYFIKADKGLLIADRVVQNSISWDALNAAKYIQGVSYYPKTNSTDAGTVWYNTYDLFNIFTGDFTLNFTLGWIDATLNPGLFGIKISAPNKALPFNLNSDAFLGVEKYPEWGATLASHRYPAYSYVNATAKDNYTFTVTRVGDKVSGFIKYENGSEPLISNTMSLSGDAKIIFYGTTSTTLRTFSLPLTNTTVNGSSLKTELPKSIFNVNLHELALLRSLTGGNAYLGADGKPSLTDSSLGAWPVNNEWDKYVVKSSLDGKITAGDDNVWHWKCMSWCQDTSINGSFTANYNSCSSDNTFRTRRGNPSIYSGSRPWPITALTPEPSNMVAGYDGFRPVIEYPDDSHCTNFWY